MRGDYFQPFAARYSLPMMPGGSVEYPDTDHMYVTLKVTWYRCIRVPSREVKPNGHLIPF
jgi:hypothetical protein